MSQAPDQEKKENPETAHISIQNDPPSIRQEGEPSTPLTDSKGWDGKLRVQKAAVVANPEALSDPEYSDDENVLEGEEIAADEGKWRYSEPNHQRKISHHDYTPKILT